MCLLVEHFDELKLLKVFSCTVFDVYHVGYQGKSDRFEHLCGGASERVLDKSISTCKIHKFCMYPSQETRISELLNTVVEDFGFHYLQSQKILLKTISSQ